VGPASAASRESSVCDDDPVDPVNAASLDNSVAPDGSVGSDADNG
jgi:hypothetical protein